VRFPPETQVYTASEIAAAAGLPVADVRAALGDDVEFASHAEAVALAAHLRAAARRRAVAIVDARPEPFATIVRTTGNARRGPLALSGAAHVLAISAAVLAGSFQVAPHAHAIVSPETRGAAPLVFLNLPGPGGGGGGGGRREAAPAPKARRTGTKRVSSPIPDAARQPPVPVAAQPPPLAGETFPIVDAPVVAVPADDRDRIGALDEPPGEPRSDSRGPGAIAGTGTGAGHGIGTGAGSGIGEGSGGGAGGGVYRPGAGITPPRVLREVKASYTDAARRAGITGEVVLEVVVRRDGSVGDVRIIRGLDAGLDTRAVDAVRQWRFAPATRQGAAVDVFVEIAVEFALK
jgi:TonB family protein